MKHEVSVALVNDGEFDLVRLVFNSLQVDQHTVHLQNWFLFILTQETAIFSQDFQNFFENFLDFLKSKLIFILTTVSAADRI